MRTTFVLLALSLLSALCYADPINVTDYQMNITATWTATNPLCGTNCTETMDISYVFELNNAPEGLSDACINEFCAGWVQLNTVHETSSGFLGSFISPSLSGLYEDDLTPGADSLDFLDSLPGAYGYPDEIDLGYMGPGLGLEKNAGPYMFIYDCLSESCQNAYPRTNTQEEKMPSTESSTAVQVPAGDNNWALLLASIFICAGAWWVKHRLDLTPSRLVYRREC